MALIDLHTLPEGSPPDDVTALGVRARAAGDLRTVVVLAPSHRLGIKAADLIRQEAGDEFTVEVWRGRGANDPDRPGHKMCDDLPAVGDGRPTDAAA